MTMTAYYEFLRWCEANKLRRRCCMEYWARTQGKVKKKDVKLECF